MIPPDGQVLPDAQVLKASRLSVLPLAGLAVLLSLALGCTDSERTAPPPTSASSAFSPAQFPDLPLPRGYVFSPDKDQLAVALAGGTVRRFDVTMEQRESAEPQSFASLLGEMQRDLTAAGWVAAPGHNDLREWVKGQDRLVLETGRTGARTTIRLRLLPAPIAGP